MGLGLDGELRVVAERRRDVITLNHFEGARYDWISTLRPARS